MTDWRVGTSGWHYRHWAGDFYPAGLPPRDWLAFYAQHFDTVELNASFYRQPTPAAWRLWRETAPPGFTFAVKASRYLTHLKRLIDPADPLDRLLNGARQLGPTLGPILYQLPGGFEATPGNRARFAAFLVQLPAKEQHAVEFRHRSWATDATFELLRAHGVALCAADMPGAEMPLVATAPFFYVRFHGSGARCSGGYPRTELERRAALIADRAKAAATVYCYFNNDIGGHAPRDATILRALVAPAAPPRRRPGANQSWDEKAGP